MRLFKKRRYASDFLNSRVSLVGTFSCTLDLRWVHFTKSFGDKHTQWDGNEPSWLPKLIKAWLHPSVKFPYPVLMASSTVGGGGKISRGLRTWPKKLHTFNRATQKNTQALWEHIIHCVPSCCLFLFNAQEKVLPKKALFVHHSLPSTDRFSLFNVSSSLCSLQLSASQRVSLMKLGKGKSEQFKGWGPPKEMTDTRGDTASRVFVCELAAKKARLTPILPWRRSLTMTRGG